MKKYNLQNNCVISRWIKRQNKQVVVLLGAGAAIPWNAVSTQRMKEILMADETYTIFNGTTVGKYLFDILDRYYGYHFHNFETFIAVLEDIMNFVLNDTNEGKSIYNTAFTPAIFDLNKERIKSIFEGRSDEREFSFELFRHYINLVINEIDKYNSNIGNEEYRELNASLIAFTKYFLNRGYSVKFYTTNYDNLMSFAKKS